LKAPDYGAVFLWDHEEEAEDDVEPTETNLYHVADSFAEFWERIEPIDPDVYPAQKKRERESRTKQRGGSPREPEANGQS
jgi:hypothetical protein